MYPSAMCKRQVEEVDEWEPSTRTLSYVQRWCVESTFDRKLFLGSQPYPVKARLSLALLLCISIKCPRNLLGSRPLGISA